MQPDLLRAGILDIFVSVTKKLRARAIAASFIKKELGATMGVSRIVWLSEISSLYDIGLNLKKSRMAVTLPDINTDQGTIVRLFLSESRNPSFANYDADEVKKGMQAMKAAIDNRLNNNPAQFLAPGATNYRDIVTAPNQFAGFSQDASGNVIVDAAVQTRLDSIVQNANNEYGPAFGPWTDIVNNAQDVARFPVQDPFSGLPAQLGGIEIIGGCFGWKTDGSLDPGGKFVKIPDTNGGAIAGNRFYTLRQ